MNSINRRNFLASGAIAAGALGGSRNILAKGEEPLISGNRLQKKSVLGGPNGSNHGPRDGHCRPNRTSQKLSVELNLQAIHHLIGNRYHPTSGATIVVRQYSHRKRVMESRIVGSRNQIYDFDPIAFLDARKFWSKARI